MKRCYCAGMGLLDDASNLQSDHAKREAAAKAALEQAYSPWSPDWAIELAGLLTDRAIPVSPVYLQNSLTRPVAEPTGWRRTSNCEYWGQAWALRGWSPDPEWGTGSVQVLLTTSGSLWADHPASGTFHSLKDRGLLRGDRWQENVDSYWVSYPDVQPGHRRFLTVQYRPTKATSAPTSKDLRKDVGISVAAALSAGPVYGDDWIEGVKL